MEILQNLVWITLIIMIKLESQVCWSKILGRPSDKPATVVQSVVRLAELLDTERHLVVELQHYVHAEIQRIQVVKNALQIAKASVNTKNAGKDTPIPESKVYHPVAALKLVEQFVYGWNSLIQKGANQSRYDELVKSTEKHKKVGEAVTDEDLVQSAKSIVRLQEIYKLDPRELANGTLQGKQVEKLGVDDCRNLALLSMERGSFDEAFSWLDVAFQQTGEEDSIQSNLWTLAQMSRAGKQFYESDVLEQDVDLSYDQHDLLHDHLAWETPPYDLPDGKQGFWDESRETMWTLGQAVSMDIPDPHRDVLRYATLCRGGQVITNLPIDTRQGLSCRYSTMSICKYCLYKEEVLHRQPLIKRIHDFLTDRQADTLIERGKREMEPAETAQYEYNDRGELTKRGGISDQRIGMVGWVYNTSTIPHITSLNARVKDVTGLDADGWAEQWQIGVYGIAGHYGPHKDADTAFHNLYVKGKLTGDRIATFMIYLSDVEDGGATVFPELSISVQPIKNSAVMWYNLSHDGDHDNSLKHGSCPVIHGHKWIANKWIHERGQEFNRPCGLQQNSYYGDTLHHQR